jgi:hypothetical protein
VSSAPGWWITGFALVVVVLNAAAWLVRLVPAVFGRNPASLLEGDPASGIASSSMVPVFAAVALIIAVPLACYLRNVDRTPHDAEGEDRDASLSR